MIHTNHLLCHHGLLKPDYYDCFPSKDSPYIGLTSPSVNLNQNVMLNESTFVEQSFMYDPSINDKECETKYVIQNIKNQSIVLPKEIAKYLIEKVNFILKKNIFIKIKNKKEIFNNLKKYKIIIKYLKQIVWGRKYN